MSMTTSLSRSRLPPIQIPQHKNVEFELSSSVNGNGGSLSPDLCPSTPPTFPQNPELQPVSRIGQYILLEQLDIVGQLKTYKAVHCDTQEDYTCKVVPIEGYRECLNAYLRAGSHEHVNEIQEIILGKTQAYVFFAATYGDLHSYVRGKRKLKESEVIKLFRQIVTVVQHCHDHGIVLRDLKLRKFFFIDPQRTHIVLDGLEDARVLDDHENDKLLEKHGCPAYVSPEILHTNQFYSGKAADIWSLGVMLYTMLIGRYPFHDTEPNALFTKIRKGLYSIPDTISSRAKCLIRGLLRKNPMERLEAEDVLRHPWLNHGPRHYLVKAEKNKDQCVPYYPSEELKEAFL